MSFPLNGNPNWNPAGFPSAWRHPSPFPRTTALTGTHLPANYGYILEEFARSRGTRETCPPNRAYYGASSCFNTKCRCLHRASTLFMDGIQGRITVLQTLWAFVHIFMEASTYPPGSPNALDVLMEFLVPGDVPYSGRKCRRFSLRSSTGICAEGFCPDALAFILVRAQPPPLGQALCSQLDVLFMASEKEKRFSVPNFFERYWNPKRTHTMLLHALMKHCTENTCKLSQPRMKNVIKVFFESPEIDGKIGFETLKRSFAKNVIHYFKKGEFRDKFLLITKTVFPIPLQLDDDLAPIDGVGSFNLYAIGLLDWHAKLAIAARAHWRRCIKPNPGFYDKLVTSVDFMPYLLGNEHLPSYQAGQYNPFNGNQFHTFNEFGKTFLVKFFPWLDTAHEGIFPPDVNANFKLVIVSARLHWIGNYLGGHLVELPKKDVSAVIISDFKNRCKKTRAYMVIIPLEPEGLILRFWPSASLLDWDNLAKDKLLFIPYGNSFVYHPSLVYQEGFRTTVGGNRYLKLLIHYGSEEEVVNWGLCEEPTVCLSQKVFTCLNADNSNNYQNLNLDPKYVNQVWNGKLNGLISDMVVQLDSLFLL